MGFATGVMRITVDITWRSIPSRFASATVVNRIVQFKRACPVSLNQNVSERDCRLLLLLLLLYWYWGRLQHNNVFRRAAVEIEVW